MTAAVPPIVKKDPMARLTLVALAIALIVVAVRVTLTESVRPNAGGVFGDLPAAPGPTTTLLLDLLCWTPAVLVLVRRAIDPQYVLRLHVSHALMLALAIWVWASTFWAGDRFAAVINASTWSAAMALGWAMSQLVRSWMRLRTVLSLAIGILLILIAQVGIYRFFDHAATVRDFESRKAEIFAANHWNEDDPIAKQFAQKVRSGEVISFYRSPNTLAACAALAAFITAGFAVQRKLDKDSMGFPVALAAAGALGVVLLAVAGSRTSLAGTALFAIVLAAGWPNRKRLDGRQRLLFGIGCTLFAAGVAAIVVIGLRTGGLVQDSLNFRWNYWVASWRLWQDHKWIGVGWSSFGDSYLKFRLPVATEEIKDPHNFLIHFLTETGAIGATLVIAWIARSWFEMTRPLRPPAPAAAATGSRELLPMASIVAGVYLLLHIVANESSTLLQANQNLADLFITLMKPMLFAVLLMLGLIIGGVHGGQGTGDLSADPRPAPFLLWATLAGLGGFLLHNLVDFAMFENGPLVLMMFVIGSVLGVRHGSIAGKRLHTGGALAGLAAVFLVILVQILMLLVPIASAEAKAAEGDAAAANKTYNAAIGLYNEATAAAPVPNAEYVQRAARAAVSAGDVDAARGLTTRAMNANPTAVQPWLDLARLGRQANDTPSGVITNYVNVILRNPADPNLRIEYGNYLDQIGQRDAASNEYRAALAANNAMHADEPRRLPASRVAELEARLK